MSFSGRSWYLRKAGQGLLMLVLVSGLAAQISETRPRIGVPEDWSHHRVRFNSAVLRQHPEIAARDPRALMQLYRESINDARAAMQRSLASPSAFASVSTPHRDWSVLLGASINFGQFPAKWQADPTALPSCTTDYVVMALNVPGVTGGQPSIVGLTRLFAGGANPLCTGNQPLFLFSYNTTTLPAAAQGRILSSPVLSVDGKRVAFIETSTVAGQLSSVLHVLNIPTSGSQATATPAALPPAGAMSSTPIAAFSNRRSSLFVDYASDTGYVGLDNGRVYKITGVFKGTPTVAGAPWPVLTQNNAILTSPVIDPVTGQVFIGAGTGILYTFNINSPPTPPASATPITVGRPAGRNPGIVDTPLLDVTGNSLFAITSNANTLTGAAVVQVSETSPFPILTSVLIGQGSTAGTSINLYDGDFDNNYFTNPDLTHGHMLVCGTGAATNNPFRYLLGFNASGIIQPGPSTQLSTNAGARCGPVTDYFNPNINGGTDFFFWSVTSTCPGLASGCVMALANETTLTTAAETGGTSGILIDNDYVTKTGGSSIYFSTQANPLNAVKLTQQGLQ